MPSEKSTAKRFRFMSHHRPYDSGDRQNHGSTSHANNTMNTGDTTGSSSTGSSSNRMASTGNLPRGGTRSRARWAMECSKLLEAMWELDESKPFRRPVDPIKYPGFYSSSFNPLDLQKIRIKFQQGVYPTPDDFAKDVYKMFDYYKSFFSDPQSQIYAQAHQLTWWFDSEIGRIRHSTSAKHKKKISRSPSQFTSRFASNSNSNSNNSTPSLMGASNSVQQQQQQTLPRLQPQPQPQPQSQPPPVTVTADTNIVLSIKHGHCTILQHPSNANDNGTIADTPSSLSQQQATPSVTVTTAQTSMESYSTLSSSTPRSTTAVSTPTTSSSSKPQTASVAKATPASTLQVELEISTVWCGACKFRPNRAVTLNAEGFTMYLKKNEAELPFRIKADDIVRCMGHIEKTRKHTLFVSLLPACSRRFANIFGDKSAMCSLLAMFFPAVDTSTISHIIHIFWLMSKKSIFGQLFSEVDSKAALDLLGHIRPAILSRITSPPGGQGGTASATAKAATTTTAAAAAATTPTAAATPINGSVPARAESRKSSAETLVNLHSAVKRLRDEVADKTAQFEQAQAQSRISTPVESTSGSSNPPSVGSTLSRSGTSRAELAMSGQMVNQLNDDILNLTNWLTAPPSVPIPPLRRESMSPRQQATPAAPAPMDLSSTNVEAQPSANSFLGSPQQAVTLSGASSGDISVVQIDEDDDSDLEIVVPADEDDMTVNDEKEEADGEDLMVMSEKISIKCPITQQVMKHPIKNKHCGHAYDRTGIEQLIKDRAEKARCPVPGCSNALSLRIRDMVPDFELWSLIQSKLNNQNPKF